MIALKNLAVALWNDDAGSVIATEYMILGSTLALGTVVGLDTVSDATNSELQEYGNSIRGISQGYSTPRVQTRAASKQGSAAVDVGAIDGVSP